MGVDIMRTILPTFQFLILLVQLSQELIALVGDLIGGLGLLFDPGWLDYDLRLHADLRVLVLHYHYFRLLAWQD